MQTQGNEYRDNAVIAKMSRIKHKIAIMSNKGGVGKSTVSVNVAISLAMRGFNVGFLDADLHGPSSLKMFGLTNEKHIASNESILPLQSKEGVHVVSIAGLLENDDAPIIWRGPVKMKILKDLLVQVEWGDLDFLIIDLPPGTGDESLSVCQLMPDLDGVVIVTTPQEIALLDVRKGINFVKKLNISIIGVVENMSALVCPHCNEIVNFLGKGGAKNIVKDFDVQLLGELVFDPKAVELADKGESFLKHLADSQISKQFNSIVDNIKFFIENKI